MDSDSQEKLKFKLESLILLLQKVILKLEYFDEKIKQKAMKKVSGLEGIVELRSSFYYYSIRSILTIVLALYIDFV